MEMRKIEWKRILLAKEYFYTSLFNFQSEQLVVNVAENIKLKNCRIQNFFLYKRAFEEWRADRDCSEIHLRVGRKKSRSADL